MAVWRQQAISVLAPPGSSILGCHVGIFYSSSLKDLEIKLSPP